VKPSQPTNSSSQILNIFLQEHLGFIFLVKWEGSVRERKRERRRRRRRRMEEEKEEGEGGGRRRRREREREEGGDGGREGEAPSSSYPIQQRLCTVPHTPLFLPSQLLATTLLSVCELDCFTIK
jgi:hypothetical protein